MTWLKFLPLLFVGVVGWFFVRGANFGPFNASHGSLYSCIGVAASVALFSFIGVEVAAMTAKRVKNPRRNVGRASVIGTGVSAILYLLVAAAVMGLVPHHALVGNGAPFVNAFQTMFPHGTWAGKLIAAVAVVSGIGALNGWTLVTTECSRAPADDGLFPKAFAWNDRNGTAWFGIVFFGRACLAADRHDEPAGPPPGQVIDRGDQFGAQLLVTGERDRGPPVADEGIQQLPLHGVGGEPADQRGVGDEQSKAGSFALHQRVRALRGGVADVVSRLEQARQALLAVQQRGGLREAVEQAPAQVKGSGQRLGVADLIPVDDADVGERSAVVDVNQPGHGAPSCLRADGGVRVGKPVRAEIRPASHQPRPVSAIPTLAAAFARATVCR